MADTPSSFVLSAYTARVKESIAIQIYWKNAGYRHDLTAAVGSSTYPIATGVKASCTWEIPEECLNDFSGAEAVCTISCTTKTIGGVVIGTRTAELLLKPPADAFPTVSEGWCIVRRDNREMADSGFPYSVRGFTRIRAIFDGTKVTVKPGATLAGFSVSYNGKTYPAVDGEALTDPVYEAVAELLYTVTDSRGLSYTESRTVTLLDYAPPTLTGADAYRCDSLGAPSDNGHWLRVKGTAQCTPLNGANTAALTAAYKPKGGSYGAEKTLTSGVYTILNDAEISETQSYTVRLTARDRVGGTVDYEQQIPPRGVTLHLKNGGIAVGIGKYAEGTRKLECAWDMEIDGGLTVGGKSLLDLTYPVGSVYSSVDAAADPETLFGGVWQQLGSGADAVYMWKRVE